MKPSKPVYVGAIPRGLNQNGERVFQVFIDYVAADGEVVCAGCYTFMTARGQ